MNICLHAKRFLTLCPVFLDDACMGIKHLYETKKYRNVFATKKNNKKTGPTKKTNNNNTQTNKKYKSACLCYMITLKRNVTKTSGYFELEEVLHCEVRRLTII